MSTKATTTGVEAGAAGAAGAVVEAFVKAIVEAEGDAWRQARLLAYVRLRKNAKLVELAKILAWREETRWHALEILRRNGVGDTEMPRVEKWDCLRIDPRTGICVVWVPPGEFWMGSENGLGAEKPRHRVVVTEGFWMGKHAVTNGEYGRYLEENPEVGEPEYWKDPRFNGTEQPVVGVRWSDAEHYCERSGCRLANEAEWEHACRAETAGEYSFEGGEAMLGKFGWHGEEWYKGSAHGVGLLRPNGNGLYDVHGNVWEWCGDVWDGKAYGKRGDGWEGRAWTEEDAGGEAEYWGGREEGALRVFRGGSWASDAADCRSAYRIGYHPGNRSYLLGFRVVFPEAGRAPGGG